MKLIVGEHSWEFEDGFQGMVNSILNVEAIAMEKATDKPFEALCKSLVEGSRLAVTAFVWVLRKRAEPTLRFVDVTFREGEFSIDISDEQAAAEAAEAESDGAQLPPPEAGEPAPETS